MHNPKQVFSEKDKMTDLNIADCINETCPWSGDPVQADSLTEYNGQVVGFCNPGCRDKFDTAVRHFEAAKAAPDHEKGAPRECLKIEWF